LLVPKEAVMSFSFVKHNNKDVLFINHRGLMGQDLFESFKTATQYMLEKKQECLVVADFTDTTGNKELNDYLQSDEAKAVSKYIVRQGTVGMTGIKKMALRVYSSFTGLKSGVFDTVEEAMEYVTK
jgi:hypothetical protein